MRKSAKLWPLLLLGMAVLAIVLLAAGLPQLELFPGGQFPAWIFSEFQLFEDAPQPAPPDPSPSPSNFWRTAIIIFIWVVLILWIITFILVPQARKRLLMRMVGYGIILLIMYLLFSRLQPLENTFETEGAGEDIGGPFAEIEGPPVQPGFIDNPPQWLVMVITLILVALVLGVVWFLWRLRSQRMPPEEPMELLALEAQQALETLQAGSDLKDTVMRCYQDMSHVLNEQRGIQRQKAMTPREFEQHLAEIGFGDDYIRRLTRLFESVRYGDNISSEREKREAVDCLNAIVRAYGRT